MSDLNLTDAFAKYGAKLSNRQWAFSAIAPDGSLVVSCWQHKITVDKGIWLYSDKLSRLRYQTPGRNLFEKHLVQARDEKLVVRIVIVSTKDTEIVDNGEDASKIKKSFDTRENYFGQIVSFDGDAFVIEFKQRAVAL